jgi:hypothetical protein
MGDKISIENDRNETESKRLSELVKLVGKEFVIQKEN